MGYRIPVVDIGRLGWDSKGLLSVLAGSAAIHLVLEYWGSTSTVLGDWSIHSKESCFVDGMNTKLI